MSVSLAYKIANQLNRACALEITTTAIEAIEECLGEAMRTEKNLRLTSKIAKRAELEHDLEIWRQAYNAALAGYETARMCSEEFHAKHDHWAACPNTPEDSANEALIDYRAKREEMGLLRSEPRVDLDTTERNCFSLHQASKDCHGDGHYTCAKCARKIRGEG